MYLLSNMAILGIHVSFQGCNCLKGWEIYTTYPQSTKKLQLPPAPLGPIYIWVYKNKPWNITAQNLESGWKWCLCWNFGKVFLAGDRLVVRDAKVVGPPTATKKGKPFLEDLACCSLVIEILGKIVQNLLNSEGIFLSGKF